MRILFCFGNGIVDLGPPYTNDYVVDSKIEVRSRHLVHMGALWVAKTVILLIRARNGECPFSYIGDCFNVGSPITAIIVCKDCVMLLARQIILGQFLGAILPESVPEYSGARVAECDPFAFSEVRNISNGAFRGFVEREHVGHF